jgi:hypothetical protein
MLCNIAIGSPNQLVIGIILAKGLCVSLFNLDIVICLVGVEDCVFIIKSSLLTDFSADFRDKHFTKLSR